MLENSSHVPLNHILVLPANLMAQAADRAVLSSRLKPQHSQRLRDNHSLLLIVGTRDTLKDLETFHSSGSASSLVRNHTPDGFVENTGRGAEVEGT